MDGRMEPEGYKRGSAAASSLEGPVNVCPGVMGSLEVPHAVRISLVICTVVGSRLDYCPFSRLRTIIGDIIRLILYNLY